MDWNVLELVFELKSPLSVGWFNHGNFSRTRLYIPGRNFWAAATENTAYLLASRSKKQDNIIFNEAGNWMLANTAFSYFFLLDDNHRLFSWPTESREYNVWFESYESEVKEKLVTSYVSTAIDGRVGSAQEETLHEVEVISNRFKNFEEAFDENGFIVPVRIKGYLFLKAELSDEFTLDYLQSSSGWLREIFFTGALFSEMSIGGNRTSGLGKIVLCGGYPRLLDKEELIFGLYKLCDTNLSRPCLMPWFDDNEVIPVMAHLKKKNVNPTKLRGELEALSFFDNRKKITSELSEGFTKKSAFQDLFWVPGSMLINDAGRNEIVINKDMLWDFVW
jgi:hypothetical protein